jgi:cytochrome c-type biogenesis protein CcmH
MNASLWIFAALALTLIAAFGASLYWAGGRGQHGAPRGQSLILALLVPLAIVALYAARGTPQALNTFDPNAMVQRLADRLRQNPGDMDGWLMLARSYTALGRYAEADSAYQHAQTRVMQDSDLLVAWVQLRVMLAEGKFDAQTGQLLDQATQLAPDDPDVMLLRALAAFDRGDKAGADALVDKLHARFPPGTPDRQNLDAVLEKWDPRGTAANPHPAASPAGSVMPDPNAMVQRLADRLKEHPEDMDGWLKLARSYAALGRPQESADAYEHAQARAMQDSNALTIWIEMRLRMNGMKFDARSDELLAQATKLWPDDPDVLLLRVLSAYGKGDKAGGDALLGKLQAQFPPGTPQRQSLDTALQVMMPSDASGKP